VGCYSTNKSSRIEWNCLGAFDQRIIVCLVCGFRVLGLREFGFRELGFRLLIHHQGWEYCLGGWRTCDIVLRSPQLDHVRRDALETLATGRQISVVREY